MAEPTISPPIKVSLNLPCESLRFVLVQPQVEENAQRGYVLTPTSEKAEGVVFERALTRLIEDDAHFLILPEYSLPAAKLDDLTKTITDRLPEGRVVIAGMDAMPYAQYDQAVQGQHGAPAPGKAYSNKWVNTAVVWVKDKKGKVSRYIQAKLMPAREEMIIGGMLDSDYLLRFADGDFSFALLICRDLYANVKFARKKSRRGPDSQTLGEWLSDQWSKKPVDMLFWLQYNTEPEKPKGLAAVQALVESWAVHCVVAANHAGYGKSAFYFPPGPFIVKANASRFPDTYTFEKVKGQELFRARFRSDEPSVFLFTYRPARYNKGEPGMVPITPEGEWRIQPDGELSGGTPVTPLTWGYAVASSQFDPTKKYIRPDGTSRFVSKFVFQAHLDKYGAIQGKVRDLTEEARSEITQTLFRGDPGEPTLWDSTKRERVADLIGTLSALSSTGEVHIPSGEQAIVARMEVPPRFITIVDGDKDENLRYCGEMAASFLTTTNRKGMPGPMSIMVLDHDGELDSVPIREMVENKLRHYAPQLSKVEAAEVPADQAPMQNQKRIDGSDVAMVTAHSYQRLETILKDSQNVDELAEAVKKEVTS